MDEYECLDQFFNYEDDLINYSEDFSSHETNSTNNSAIVNFSSSVPNCNFQCDSLQSFQSNQYQPFPQHNAGFNDRVQNNYTIIRNQGTSKVQNYSLPNFATNTSNGLQSLSQGSAIIDQCNGNGTKPRLRARRGQATDPHSIAERLRREKIADRMKNLQELLPNPNRTDKASMLDEIIEYVKFLQMQIKILSESRAGAPDAVVPLIGDDNQSEVVGYNYGLSSEVEFERELVRLMESNATKAMQFLQTKGLSLVPLSFANSKELKPNVSHFN